MKIVHAIIACIMLNVISTQLLPFEGLDDLFNDPFFQSLAQQLDDIFEKEELEESAHKKKSPEKKPSNPRSQAEKVSKKTSSTQGKETSPTIVSEDSKDLKTLFIENIDEDKKSKTKSSFKGKKTTSVEKVVISTKKMSAYKHYMNGLVKKTRMIEKITTGNPGRTFGHAFIADFYPVIAVVDQLEASHHLIVSKKMYPRIFFGQPLQKTREHIVNFLPKIDALLKKLRPILDKEESLENDISMLEKEAKKATPQHLSKQEKIERTRKSTPPQVFPVEHQLSEFLKKGSLHDE